MRIIIKPAGLVVLTIGFIIALLNPFMGRLRAHSISAHQASTIPAAPVLGGSAAAQAPIYLGSGWTPYTEKEALCQFKALDEPGLPGHPAYHFDVQRTGAQQWNVGFNNGVSGGAIRDGELLRVRFWGRAPQHSKVCVLMQKSVAPFPHCWKQYVALEPKWKSYEFTFHSAAYAPGEALVTLFLGIDVGTIDLADIRLERAG